MPLYFFRISHGRYSGASDQGSPFASHEAAWAEMTQGVCRPSQRHFPQPEAKRRLANGNAGRGQKARIQNPLDGGNAELAGAVKRERSRSNNRVFAARNLLFAIARGDA
jgi:hypothetical protein